MTFGILVPIISILIVNCVLFVLILRKHCLALKSPAKSLTSTSTKSSNLKRQTVILSTCFVNMGITWIFGFLVLLPVDENTRIAFSFLFCIFNSIQGFLIFLIYIVLSKSRRNYMRYAAAEKLKKFRNAVSTGDFKSIHKTNSNNIYNTTSTEIDSYSSTK